LTPEQVAGLVLDMLDKNFYIFLAIIMLLGTVSVIGNAALAKDQIAYDSIDNAKLTPEQVAGIVLDMLDNDLLRLMATCTLKNAKFRQTEYCKMRRIII